MDNKENYDPLSARHLLAQAMSETDATKHGHLANSAPATEKFLGSIITPLDKKSGGLKDIQVEFVRSPSRGVDFDNRHNNLLITENVIEVLLSQEKEHIDELRRSIANKGGFLMRYHGVGEERLRNVYDNNNPQKGGWLMQETSGIVYKDGAPITEGRVIGADGQFFIPPDDETANTDLFPLLQNGKDQFLDAENLSEDVRKNPASAMLVADISSVSTYNGLGFAAATEDAAFNRIKNEINFVRSTSIKYIFAAIASVKAVTNSKKELLAPPLEPEGMRNYRSIILHTLRGNASGYIHGKQRHHYVPVGLPAGDRGYLLVDWYVTVQDLENIEPRTDLQMSEENI